MLRSLSTKKGNDFFISNKKIIPVENHLKFLKGFYDNLKTSFQGYDQILPKLHKIMSEYPARI
jgi:hypothetical protein